MLLTFPMVDPLLRNVSYRRLLLNVLPAGSHIFGFCFLTLGSVSAVMFLLYHGTENGTWPPCSYRSCKFFLVMVYEGVSKSFQTESIKNMRLLQ
jgi:hypothetical protein